MTPEPRRANSPKVAVAGLVATLLAIVPWVRRHRSPDGKHPVPAEPMQPDSQNTRCKPPNVVC
ncbi:hypothetical protein [Streptomyces sp. SID3343]|uniref:hypothetical protein n=1 Tax=Streptomyces sp. SID3343 TaxID=2690260 RepID=UPI00136B0FD2|nr:hypothetical protein [Streptomyces sp. SID3343]MYW02706.1 hypothetical protein [Streptomyces sp. SID3343]